MMKAVWNEMVVAESDDTVVVEGNHYFPPASVKPEFLRPSERTSECPWKGTAKYYDILVGDKTNPGAAWHYDDPKPAAEQIRGRIAFWKGVSIES
jgi:uncharacterized protein (DUF427 family)